jgi:hypothetical protein
MRQYSPTQTSSAQSPVNNNWHTKNVSWALHTICKYIRNISLYNSNKKIQSPTGKYHIMWFARRFITRKCRTLYSRKIQWYRVAKSLRIRNMNYMIIDLSIGILWFYRSLEKQENEHEWMLFNLTSSVWRTKYHNRELMNLAVSIMKKMY